MDSVTYEYGSAEHVSAMKEDRLSKIKDDIKGLTRDLMTMRRRLERLEGLQTKGLVAAWPECPRDIVDAKHNESTAPWTEEEYSRGFRFVGRTPPKQPESTREGIQELWRDLTHSK